MVSAGRRILDIQYRYGMGPRDQRLLEIRQCARVAYQTARKKAAKCEIPFALTAEELDDIILESDGRCAVTGIPFSVVKTNRATRRPWAPSLDRIFPDQGYTRKNCRLVCVAVNIAMNEWGEFVLYGIVRGLAKNRPEKFKALMEEVNVHD